MSNMKLYTDKAETWVMSLALFSLGVDGLAYLIFAKDRPAALVCVPILLAWQVVVVTSFFRHFLPAYKLVDQTDFEHSKVYIQLLRIALILPAIIAIVVWAVLPTLSPSRH